jgi:hypothetical protein
MTGNVIDAARVGLQSHDHENGGFYHPTSGMAAAFLDLLRDRGTCNQFLGMFRVQFGAFCQSYGPTLALHVESNRRSVAG